MQSSYIRTNHSKHYLKAHITLVCKYRKKLLVGQLKEDRHNILENISLGSDFTVEVYGPDLDHYHFLIRYIPRLSIPQIVRRPKQQSTYLIWQNHSVSLSKQFWRKKQFWSDGFFVCPIGEASPETIRQYILSQG